MTKKQLLTIMFDLGMLDEDLDEFLADTKVGEDIVETILFAQNIITNNDSQTFEKLLISLLMTTK